MNLAQIKLKIGSLFRSSLAVDTLWMLLSKLFNVVMQALYFIVVARMLGAQDYGYFIGITALASIIFPFLSLGSEHILVKYVAVDRAVFSTYWGNSLILLIANGTALTILLLILSPLIFAQNIALGTIFLILLADLLCLGIFDLGAKALMAVKMVKKTAQLGILNTCSKLIAALSLAAFFNEPNASTWAYLYLTSSLVMTALTCLLVTKLIDYPRPKLSELKARIGEGIYFSISGSAQNINTNLDKTMLTSLANATATGIYGSAYRFIDVGNVVLLALFGATYTRFFEHGASGIKSALAFARRLLPLLTIYAVVSVTGFFVFAPVVPILLGAEFTEAIAALRWLAPLPAIAAFQFLAADTLTGSGHQKARSIVQVSSAVLNILLNIWLIPLYSWKGAAWATLLSDSLRLICLWGIIFVLYRRASTASFK